MRPPELAGRDEIRNRAEIVLGRSKLGMPVKSMIEVDPIGWTGLSHN